MNHNGKKSYKGIIPAYAGSTEGTVSTLANGEDHPRVCGEHGLAEFAPDCVKGSSPRMRGAPKPDVGSRVVRGIIPAYAGSTTAESLTPRRL